MCHSHLYIVPGPLFPMSLAVGVFMRLNMYFMLKTSISTSRNASSFIFAPWRLAITISKSHLLHLSDWVRLPIFPFDFIHKLCLLCIQCNSIQFIIFIWFLCDSISTHFIFSAIGSDRASSSDARILTKKVISSILNEFCLCLIFNANCEFSVHM